MEFSSLQKAPFRLMVETKSARAAREHQTAVVPAKCGLPDERSLPARYLVVRTRPGERPLSTHCGHSMSTAVVPAFTA